MTDGQLIRTSGGFRSIFSKLQNKKLITPYLDLAVTQSNWPKKYTITIDSGPYYGLDESGEPDGYFHPSTHAGMGARLLWYMFHPLYRDKIEYEPASLQREMTFAMGSSLHGVVQTQFTKIGLCKCECVPGETHTCEDIEREYLNEAHHYRGRNDFIVNHPVEGRVPVEMKALAIDTPILTTKGWSTMGELRDGDEVYAPDGQPTKVLRAHPIRTGRPCFNVRFRDGQSVVADAEHLWQVNDCGNGRDRVMTTQQIVDAPWGGKNRFRVPVTEALQAPEADLPIDPWLLGMWLGDGSSAHVEITSGEADLPYLVGRLDDLGQRHRVLRHRDRAPRVSLYGLRGVFAGQNLLHHPRTSLHGTKHIPELYMLASEIQRRQLLAGLMDSDGTVGGHQATICMINRPLMRQVLQLVRSLGYRATWNESRSRLNGRDCGPVYWVKFSTTHVESPFDMPRKREAYLAKPKVAHQNLRLNAIVAVEPVESVPTRCITVAHESSLYVAGEGFVPTHNTMNGMSFSKLDDTVESMKPEWRRQLSLALDNLGYSWGILLVFQAGWPYRFEEIRYTREDALLSEIYGTADRAREGLALDEPPEFCCSYNSPTMKSCPARFVCWLALQKA